MGNILDFEQVKRSWSGKAPKLLIGNGFSVACCPDIFTYTSLLQEADFSRLSPFGKTLFDELGTQDFELVIKALLEASLLAQHYECKDSEMISCLQSDAHVLKDQLAETIAKRHPEHPSKISDEKYRACRQFLSSFDHVYSLNYDLLLYWTIMRGDEDLPPVKSDDGFRRGTLGHCGYVAWDPLEAPSQTIYYVHGALHLFDKGSEFIKFTWTDTDVRLIRQIRDALEEGRFPRIVTEGTSQAKLDRIMHSAYLHKALRSLMSISGDLVIYGMSLTPNDDHILDCIVRGKLSRVFVGVYGDPASEANRALIERASAMETTRATNGGKELKVLLYNSATAKVWG